MANEPLIVAVDDEPGILRIIKLELSTQGFRVETAPNGEDAINLVEKQRPDVVVLDVVLPDMSGLEVMRRVRERTNIPIILLTARDRDEDKIRGLEFGADDYLVKPFNPDELSARVRAVLRRNTAPVDTERVIRVRNIEIDLGRRLAKKNGELVRLTRTEWMLLHHLASNAGKVILNTELLTKVWGPEYRNDLQYLRVWVSRLRAKLEPEPSNPTIIRTLQGIGYMLDASTPTGDDDDDRRMPEPLGRQKRADSHAMAAEDPADDDDNDRDGSAHSMARASH
jgi:two-component system KDP operon response regulator KdpE